MIPDVPPFNNYNGNNYTTKFDYDLSIDDETQLVVLHTDSSEIQKELKLDVDYSIHGVGDENGGYIIFPLSTSSYGLLQEDEVISLYLSLPQEQQTPFGTSDKLDMNILEKTFDYIVKLIKITNRQVERSVKIQEGSKISPAELVESLKTSEVNAVKSALNANLSAQNAKESEQIATQKADEVSKNYIEAMADITGTTKEALDDIEAVRRAGVNGIQKLNTEAISGISNAKNTALTDINTSKTNALNSIAEDLNSAKGELLETKTEIITDLIENSTDEALAAVEDVKTNAIIAINASIENAQSELNDCIGVATNEVNRAQEGAMLAKKYAENPLDVEVEEGAYSAKHWAGKAEQVAQSIGNPLDRSLEFLTETGIKKIKELAKVEDEAPPLFWGITEADEGFEITVNNNDGLCIDFCNAHSKLSYIDFYGKRYNFEYWPYEQGYIAAADEFNAYPEFKSSVNYSYSDSEISPYLFINENGGKIVYEDDEGNIFEHTTPAYSMIAYIYIGTKQPIFTNKINPTVGDIIWIDTSSATPVLKKVSLNEQEELNISILDETFTHVPVARISEYKVRRIFDNNSVTMEFRYYVTLDKLLPFNYDWRQKEEPKPALLNAKLTGVDSDGEQKIKDIIASVGSEKIIIPWAINNTTNGANAAFTAATDSMAPSGNSPATEEYNGMQLWSCEGSFFNGVQFALTAKSYYDSGVYECAIPFYYTFNKAVLFANINNMFDDTCPAYKYFEWGTIIKSDEAPDYVQYVNKMLDEKLTLIDYWDINWIARIIVGGGDFDEEGHFPVYWLQTSTNKLFIPIRNNDGIYTWQKISNTPYVPLGEMFVSLDNNGGPTNDFTNCEGYIPIYSGLHYPARFDTYSLNKNWFNLIEPSPYLKADLNNISVNGLEKLKTIIKEVINQV